MKYRIMRRYFVSFFATTPKKNVFAHTTINHTGWFMRYSMISELEYLIRDFNRQQYLKGQIEFLYDQVSIINVIPMEFFICKR